MRNKDKKRDPLLNNQNSNQNNNRLCLWLGLTVAGLVGLPSVGLAIYADFLSLKTDVHCAINGQDIYCGDPVAIFPLETNATYHLTHCGEGVDGNHRFNGTSTLFSVHTWNRDLMGECDMVLKVEAEEMTPSLRS